MHCLKFQVHNDTGNKMGWIANNHCGNESSPDECSEYEWTYSENSEWKEDQDMSVRCSGKWPYIMVVWFCI